MSMLTNEEKVEALSRCLSPLLDALEWEGDDRTLEQARPYYLQELDESGLMNTMANLGFTSESRNASLKQFDGRLVPALFISDEGFPYVIKEVMYDSFMAYNGHTNSFEELKAEYVFGTFIFFNQEHEGQIVSPHMPQRSWFNNIFIRFRPLLVMFLGLSFVLSVTALLSPIMIISIYKFLGSADSLTNLKFIGIGILLLIFADTAYKMLRNHLQAYAGARINNIVGSEVLRRILYLSPQQTESASLGAQISRIKDLTTVRNFIDGPAATAIAELPFILIMYVVLGIIAGDLVLIPVIAAIVMIIFILFLSPWIKSINESSSRGGVEKQAFLLELIGNFHHVRYTGARDVWRERFDKVSANAATGIYRTAVINMIINTVSQGIITIAGVMTIAMGVYKVIAGEIPAAVLLGLVMLVWRILNPLKSGFSVMSQSLRIKKSVAQLNRLMQMEIEEPPRKGTHSLSNLRGHVVFQDVSLRYSADSYPALLGINFMITPGEVIVFTGHDGSGKSSILKLILGMYKPQAGRVLIDNYNIQQLNPILVRRSFSYAPKKTDLFYGTIRQNILFGESMAGEEDIMRGCDESGLSQALKQMPEGLDTRIEEIWHATAITRQIILARTFVQNRAVFLLDTPNYGLESGHVEKIAETLNGYKGKKTIIIITENELLQSLADKVITLDRGRIESIRDNTTLSGGNNEI